MVFTEALAGRIRQLLMGVRKDSLLIRLAEEQGDEALKEAHVGEFSIMGRGTMKGWALVVHHWGQQGQGDLRPFFKLHGMATKGVQVALLDRKRELATVQTGDAFLYGERLAENFPAEAYEQKWRRRAIEEPDDWQAAPCSGSNYCWEGVEQRWIPWRVLKSAWRHENGPLCQNCEQPTLLTALGYFSCGFYHRGSKAIRICP